MKKILIIIITVFCVLYMPVKSVSAEGMSVFNGLFLIEGDVRLDSVSINISVDDYKNCKVTASYEMTNNTKETQSLTLGTPITDHKIKDYRYAFTPYQYSTVVVSGSKVNENIKGINVDYDKWRNYGIPMVLPAGDSATAVISFTVEPKQDYSGKITFDVDMNHLKSWGESHPDKINVETVFNPQTVQVYNFDNEFSVKPSEIGSEYKYIWDLSKEDTYKEIKFNYYFVDDEILRQLRNLKSSRVNDVINSYNKGDYQKVVESGKGFIENTDNKKNHNRVYILMTDAYVALKDYEKALVVSDLIEVGTGDFGGLDEKIEEKMLYNKLQCYNGLKEYEEVYDLIDYELNYSDRNPYMINWLETQKQLIPDDELEKIKENRKDPTKIERLLTQFLQGEFYTYLIIGIVVILIVVVIIYIRRKKKKDRFFY